MDDSDCNSSFFGGGIDFGDIFSACTKKFHSADGGKADGETIHAVADIIVSSVDAFYITREVIVRGSAATSVVPPTKATILLIAFDFAVGADNFVALVDRSFKVGWSDPIVVEVDAPTKATILLIAFDFAVGADNFVAF